MSLKRKILLCGGTLSCALGTGFLMQQESSEQRVIRAPAPSTIQLSILPPHGASDVDDFALFQVEDITLTSALQETPERLAEPSPDRFTIEDVPVARPRLIAAPTEPEVKTASCEIAAKANVAAMARVDLSVMAPCNGNQRVTVHHSGLVFTDTTDSDGKLNVRVPALSERAVFVVAFDNGSGAVASTSVEALASVERVAIQWDGPTGIQVHAREFGASYTEPGHVWARSQSTGNGTVDRLGEPSTLAPKLAEIYSFPNDAGDRNGVVSISIEAEVTAENCAREITAQTLELRNGQSLRTRNLVLSMPNCDATGDFLVLNNLIEDLTIAAK